MKKIPILNFIIPVYNGEKYIKTAIDSILGQPCRDFHIIIVDDGSTDRSGIIADEFAKKYSEISVIHTPNHGVSSARNTGMRLVKCGYIAFLDADDVLCKDAYTYEVRAVLKEQKYDMICMGFIIADNKLKKGRVKSVPNSIYLRTSPEFNKYAMINHFCAYIYKKEILDNDMIEFPEKIKIGEDRVFLFLITRNIQTLLCMDQLWFAYRDNISSVMHMTKNASYIIDEELRAWYWCLERCSIPEDKLDCEGMIFSNVVEFIMLGSRTGLTYKNIKCKIDNCQPLIEIYKDYELFWKTKRSEEIYTNFKKNPRSTCFKIKLKGIPFSLMQRAARNKFFRNVYYFYKFTEDISKYVN